MLTHFKNLTYLCRTWAAELIKNKDKYKNK